MTTLQEPGRGRLIERLNTTVNIGTLLAERRQDINSIAGYPIGLAF